MVPVVLKGVITRVYGRDVFSCMLHDGIRAHEFSSREFFQAGESVRAQCESEGGKLVAGKVEKVPDLYPEVEERLMGAAKLQPAGKFDKTAEMLAPALERIARKIYAAQGLGRHTVVKFHGDADGISSALIFRKFLRANYAQQNGAIYSASEAMRDVERMGQQFRPLLVLLDFGSGEDSAQGLRIARSAGIEIISLDHHPPHQSSVPSFALRANPWDVVPEGGDGSRYPAGFVCSLLAPMFGAEAGGLEKLACAGDRSEIMPLSEEDRKRALVLDFVATYSGFGQGIDFYSEVLSKPELFGTILLQAESRLEEADAQLRAALKFKKTPKADIYWFNLDNISEKREFPNRGKISGRVFEIVGGNRPIVAIGVSKRTIIFRMNDLAVANGLRADSIIGAMKSSFSDFVENGGGHARAAALRITEGFEAAAVEEIIKMIERN